MTSHSLPVPQGAGALVRLGDFLFRWRSYLPLLLVPLVLVVVWALGAPLARRTERGWEIASVALALLGVALRVYTVGVAAPGTSGRNTREQKAASLNTTGPYSIVRHPLYIANSAIVVALTLFTQAWILAPIVVGLAVLYYGCIARREEVFLRQRFGAAFEAWAARVPAALPRRWRFVAPDRPFAWKVAVRREFYGVTVVTTIPFLLDLAENLRQTGHVTLDPVWTTVAAAGGVLFVVVRFLKKRTRLLRG